MSKFNIASDILNEKLHEMLKKITHFSDFEDEWNEGYFEEELLELLAELEVTIGMADELKNLYTLCQTNQKVFSELGQYIAYSNVHLRLIECSPDEEIQPFMQLFYEAPVKNIDYLMKLSNLFQLFGRIQLAVTLCEQVFTPIASDNSLWTRPEDRLAKNIFCNELQKMHLAIHSGHAPDWKAFAAVVYPYGYNLTHEDYQRFEHVSFGKIDAQLLKKQFKKAFRPALWDITAAFCCHMWDEKKMPFGTTEVLTTLVFNFLTGRLASHNCGADKFFTFDEEGLEEHISEIIGIFVSCPEDAFALAWAIPCLYSYLHSIGLVEQITLKNAISVMDSLKSKLIANLPYSHEIYHFTRKL